MIVLLLTDSVRKIKNIGERRVSQLARLSVFTVQDLIEYIPRDYEDRSDIKTISELQPEQVHTFRGVAGAAETIRIGKKTVTRLNLADSTGEITAVWFNRPYMKNNFKKGVLYIFTGRVVYKYNKLQVEVADYEIAEKQLLSNGIIVPVYSSTYKLSQKILRSLIKYTLENTADLIEDSMPESVKGEYKLCDKVFALQNIHFPSSDGDFFKARRRLVFEELFLLQLKLLQMRDYIKKEKNGVVFSDTNIKPLLSLFEFELTNAQKKAFYEVANDLTSGYVMNRIIQGDVGSGKTAVAMLASYIAIINGYQSVIMAPTDVLATQHFHSFTQYFSRLSIQCVLLTGSLSRKEKKYCYEQILNGGAQMIIGTHALIQEAVRYKNLGLIITDEQHRFGVRHRTKLTEKGSNPHVLVMTATPIPRTLGLILYGDLDISAINELPPGRQKIDTRAVDSSYHERIYMFIKKHLDDGRQAYVVCPQIEEDEAKDLKAVLSYKEQLQTEIFADYSVECVHGKMKNDIKQDIMKGFSDGKIQVLVSTTVIEVGINVPNATIMLIENADKFGLSQLHQLRGRVGRCALQSYCILVSDSKSKTSKDRLKVMTQSNDGFFISEKDLELRGPGDFFGTRQHGLPEFKIANLYRDMDILKEAQEAAARFIYEDAAEALTNVWRKNEIFTI